MAWAALGLGSPAPVRKTGAGQTKNPTIMPISNIDFRSGGAWTRGRKTVLSGAALLLLAGTNAALAADILIPIGDTYSPTIGSLIDDDLFMGGGTADIGGVYVSGTVTLEADSTIKASTSAAAVISGSIVGPGGFEKTGSNKLTLSGQNTYQGTTTISGGVLDVATGGTLGSGAVVNNALLTFSGSDTLHVTSNISGVGAITKGGLGNLVLSGNSTSTGTLTVGNGAAFVDGSFSGPAIVGGGATIGGSGSIGAVTLLSGAQLAPGSADLTFATLNLASLTWTTDSVNAGLFFDLRSNVNTSDMLAISGAFTRGSNTATLSYIFDFNGTGRAGRTYTLITWGSTNFTETWLDNFVVTNLRDGLEGTFQFSGNSLQLVVVPEPGVVGAAFGLFGIATIAAHRIRRRRSLSATEQK